MRTPAIFHWKRSRNDHFQGEGVTRDISAAGVYVLTPTCPPVNSVVQVEVIFQQLHRAATTRIKAGMKVLRVEHDVMNEGGSGFAAVGKGFTLRAISQQLSDSMTDST